MGKKVTTAELKAYISVADEYLIDEIETIIFAAIPNFPIVFHTISIAAFNAAIKLMQAKNFILIMPQSAISEFILVTNKSIEGSVSVPFGRHRLIDQIARELEVSQVEALSLLKLWKEGTLEKSKESELETITANAKEEWLICLKGALSKLSRNALLPNQIYIVGHSLESMLLGDWIKHERYSSETFLVDRFDITFLSQKNVADLFESKVPKEHVGAVMACLILFIRSL